MYGDTRPEPKSSDSQMDSGMIAQDLRDLILAEPEAILQDTAVMAALVAASDRALGSNVVDLRAIAMDRMEARLDRLEDTHRSVIAAVYENLAGTNQVHRATLLLLTPVTFEAFLQLASRRTPAYQLETDTFNLRSQAFYAKRGYQELDRYPDGEWNSGLTTLLLAKRLR